MSDFGSQITYKKLLQRHGRIQIPKIQRDYAQGRPSEEEIREEFLSALEVALKTPAGDSNLPLNLDFIYGSVEGDEETRFLPLDGQQRLTTLFLLHWYLAWKDNQWDEFRQMFKANGNARFTYDVRPSSNEFFDALVAFEPTNKPDQVLLLSDLIKEQPWYFRSWRLDPTIQSSLEVLDAIHRRFASANGLFERLINESQPAITFQLLDLNNFGLSDDLYIKMNARGKPLTAFETFKARYEQELENQLLGESFAIGSENFSIAEFVARRMDTTWSDLFWAYRNPSTNLYDDAVMNLFRAVALITRDPESGSYLNDIEVLRSEYRTPTYFDFNSMGWLDEAFTITLIRLLETWSGPEGMLIEQLPDQRYFDEARTHKKLMSRGSRLSYVEAVQFAGYAFFIKENHKKLNPEALQEWMRVVYNLSVNTSYDRSSDLMRSIGGLKNLVAHSIDILSHFATSEKIVSGFNEQQVAEERLKAELILGHKDWRSLIDRAEAHGYFKGQIGFLLDFCGVPDTRSKQTVNEWDNGLHCKLQSEFSIYWQKGNTMFSPDGLNDPGDYLWQRALLSLGNYLLPSGRNRSLLVNSSTNQSSWKRLLRGKGLDVPEARKILYRLWNLLVVDKDVRDQLDSIIKNAEGLEPWRDLLVNTPEAIGYCKAMAIRWDYDGTIYLLKRSQMNGAHAELFSYSLYKRIIHKKDQLIPLKIRSYVEAIGTYKKPHIEMDYSQQDLSIPINVLFIGDQFDIRIVEGYEDILEKLSSLGFQQENSYLTKHGNCTEVENELLSLVHTLQQLPTTE